MHAIRKYINNVVTSMTVVNSGWANKAGSFLIAAAPMHNNVPIILETEIAANIVTDTKAEKVKACIANSPARGPLKTFPFQIV